eukprot:g60784.t1
MLRSQAVLVFELLVVSIPSHANPWFLAWRSGFNWSAITIVVVTNQYMGDTTLKIRLRLIGTFLGGSFTMLLYAMWPNAYFIACGVAVVAFWSFLLMMTYTNKDYAFRMMGVTVLIVFAAANTGLNAGKPEFVYQVGVARLLGIMLGVIVGGAISLLHPRPAVLKAHALLCSSLQHLAAATCLSMRHLDPSAQLPSQLAVATTEQEELDAVWGDIRQLRKFTPMVINERPIYLSSCLPRACCMPWGETKLDGQRTQLLTKIVDQIRQMHFALEMLTQACQPALVIDYNRANPSFFFDPGRRRTLAEQCVHSVLAVSQSLVEMRSVDRRALALFKAKLDR